VTRPLVCVYLVGEPPPAVRSALGDFEAWFNRLLAPHGVEGRAVDGITSGADPRDYAGIAVSGSPASLAEPEPWMDRAVELVTRAGEVGTPLLGVCFGHQLIGVAAGGRVVHSRLGWEIATREIELTEEGRRDPLFAGLPDRFEVNLSHRDVIDPDSLPAGSGLLPLARNPKAALQAVALGDAIRGVQFHPEFDRAAVSAYVAVRRDDLAADAEARGAPEDHPDRLAIREAPAARQVFDNWIRHFVLS
jgi:GMP synthase (glutamine-hydrolysing)